MSAVVWLLVVIAVLLLVALELLRRLGGIVSGSGYTPWRFRIYDALAFIWDALVHERPFRG